MRNSRELAFPRWVSGQIFFQRTRKREGGIGGKRIIEAGQSEAGILDFLREGRLREMKTGKVSRRGSKRGNRGEAKPNDSQGGESII